MKREDISDALNLLEDDMIAEACQVRARKKNAAAKRRRWMAAAACLIFGLGIALQQSKQIPVKEAEDPVGTESGNSAAWELPKLTIPKEIENSTGYEGYLAYDGSQLVNANPWNEEQADKMAISVLPVYRNPLVYDENGRASGMDVDAMKALLLDMASRLGMDIRHLTISDDTPDEEEQEILREKLEGEIPDGYFEVNKVMAEENGIKIQVDAAMTAEISFDPAQALGDSGCFLPEASFAEIEQTAEYLQKKYKTLLAMEQPQVNIYGGNYDIFGKQKYQLSFYDKDGDAVQQILNYNFCQAEFCCDDDGKLFLIRINQMQQKEKVGNYPVISIDEAKELLLNGNYITSVPYAFPGDQYLVKTELIYRMGNREQYAMPYYRFYAELKDEERENGLKTFGAFYVPAVARSYLSNMPL